MKIAYLSTAVVPSRRASSIHIMKMCQAFARQGNDVTLVVPDRPDREAATDDLYAYYGVDPCFEVVKLPRPSLSSLGTITFQFRAGRFAKSIDTDTAYSRSMFASYFAAQSGTPTAFEQHDLYSGRKFERIRRLALKQLTKHDNFNGLVVISNWLQDYYEDKFPHLEGRILQAHDGADPIDESIDPVELDHQEKLSVGYVGSLYRGRGIDLIVELAHSCPWAEFHVIGGDEDIVETWESQTKDLQNITFHGFLPPSAVDSYRLACDVLLAPYQPDLETAGGSNTVKWMSPLKLFEYMAAGRPIICSDFPVLREVVSDGETALLCDPENSTEWIHTLESLRNNPELRKVLGQNAQKDFLNHYTWKNRAERILAFLDQS